MPKKPKKPGPKPALFKSDLPFEQAIQKALSRSKEPKKQKPRE